MATIYCSLPKELIIGKNGKKREQEYAIGVSPNAPKFTVKWEDNGNGLVAKNVTDEVAKILLKNSSYSLVDGSKPNIETPAPKPVEPPVVREPEVEVKPVIEQPTVAAPTPKRKRVAN